MIRFLEEISTGNWKLKESLLSVVPLLMPALRILPAAPRGGKSYEVVEDRKEDENMEASEKAMLKRSCQA